MSRISKVVKNKNRVEKLRRSRRKDEMTNIKQDSAFKASLNEAMRGIDVLFNKDEVEAIEITVEPELITKFSGAIYSEELAEYEIEQVEGTADKFIVRRKFIAF